MAQVLAARYSPYDDSDLMTRHVREGNHRAVIGGLWNELGALQLDFLKRQGLRGHHAFIDVGAGSFRAGVKLVPYLDAGNYYAIDLLAPLLEAGYAKEILPFGWGERFARSQFAATDAFDVSGFGRMFDFGIAQSVFTHMPIARLQDCLAALAPYFCGGGLFFVTVFLVAEQQAHRAVTQQPGGTVTAPNSDPFHTTRSALAEMARSAPGWRMEILGDWSHPRNQQMLSFERLDS